MTETQKFYRIYGRNVSATCGVPKEMQLLSSVRANEEGFKHLTSAFCLGYKIGPLAISELHIHIFAGLYQIYELLAKSRVGRHFDMITYITSNIYNII